MHFQVKNTLEKQPQSNILYMFFTAHKPQPQFLSNTHINSANYIFLKLLLNYNNKSYLKYKHTLRACLTV